MADPNTDINFEKEVIAPSWQQPVVVDFWAGWCEPCLMLEPIITELATENTNKWKLVKLNTDQQQDVAEQYLIRGIPAIRIFSQGKIIASFNGLMWKKDLGRWIDEAIAGAATARQAE